MREPTINSADDRASHPASVEAARALATFDHNAAYVEMIECQDHPVWHDYLSRADVALAAKAAYPEREAGAAPGPECCSTSPRELSIAKRTRAHRCRAPARGRRCRERRRARAPTDQGAAPQPCRRPPHAQTTASCPGARSQSGPGLQIGEDVALLHADKDERVELELRIPSRGADAGACAESHSDSLSRKTRGLVPAEAIHDEASLRDKFNLVLTGGVAVPGEVASMS